jgi:hypothetical protein
LRSQVALPHFEMGAPWGMGHAIYNPFGDSDVGFDPASVDIRSN